MFGVHAVSGAATSSEDFETGFNRLAISYRLPFYSNYLQVGVALLAPTEN